MIQNQYLKQKQNTSLHIYQLVIIYTHKLSEKENISFVVAQKKTSNIPRDKPNQMNKRPIH